MARLRALLGRLWPFGSSTSADSEAEGDGDEGTVWDAIPSWQYEGRFAEAGGISRSEQERAVSELHERVDREAEVSDHRE